MGLWVMGYGSGLAPHGVTRKTKNPENRPKNVFFAFFVTLNGELGGVPYTIYGGSGTS